MKKVVFTSRGHNGLIVLWLGGIVMFPLWLRMIETPQVASAVAFYFAALFGSIEAFNFIKRGTAWEAIKLIPCYAQKIWMTSLGIVGFYISFVVVLSFAFGNFLPPIGIGTLFALANIAIALYSRRTGSKVAAIYITTVTLGYLVFAWLRWSDTTDIYLDLLISSASSPFVQTTSIALSIIVAIVLKREIEKTTRTLPPRELSIVGAMDRFRVDVAGRWRICGWPPPSSRFVPILIFLIPFFVIVGGSHVSFSGEESVLLGSTASVVSMLAAFYIYIGSGTAFGLLKNPGLWLSRAWQFALGKSRQSLGIEFALNIVKASVVPSIVVFSVAFVHAMYIEPPSTIWQGYANFYDEAILLITTNLLCFAWACSSYPKRTMEGPDFLHIRIALCVAACLIFVKGVDFGFVIRGLLIIALAGSALLAIYVGGRRIAEIDFLTIRKQAETY